jgi:hypothetical protein
VPCIGYATTYMESADRGEQCIGATTREGVQLDLKKAWVSSTNGTLAVTVVSTIGKQCLTCGAKCDI